MAELERILITGCSGFIGRHVAAALSEKFPTATLLGVAREVSANGVFHECLPCEIGPDNLSDLRKFVATHRPQAVVHCAGALTTHTQTAMSVNLGATATLIEVVAKQDPEVLFVQIGSAAEYAPLSHPQSTKETADTIPINDYGQSKLLATELVLEATAQGQIAGVVLRLFNPVGPGMREVTLIGRMCRWLNNPERESLALGNLDTYRDYFDVRDAAQAVSSVLSTGDKCCGEIVNIGSGQGRCTRELIEGLCHEHLDKIVVDEPELGSLRSPGFVWQEAEISKAARLINWKPRYSWEETIASILRRKSMHSEKREDSGLTQE